MHGRSVPHPLATPSASTACSTYETYAAARCIPHTGTGSRAFKMLRSLWSSQSSEAMLKSLPGTWHRPPGLPAAGMRARAPLLGRCITTSADAGASRGATAAALVSVDVTVFFVVA